MVQARHVECLDLPKYLYLCIAWSLFQVLVNSAIRSITVSMVICALLLFYSLRGAGRGRNRVWLYYNTAWNELGFIFLVSSLEPLELGGASRRVPLG